MKTTAARLNGTHLGRTITVTVRNTDGIPDATTTLVLDCIHHDYEPHTSNPLVYLAGACDATGAATVIVAPDTACQVTA